MAKYIDLSSVVDVEPEVCEVLPLIEDDDLQYDEGNSRRGNRRF